MLMDQLAHEKQFSLVLCQLSNMVSLVSVFMQPRTEVMPGRIHEMGIAILADIPYNLHPWKQWLALHYVRK